MNIKKASDYLISIINDGNALDKATFAYFDNKSIRTIVAQDQPEEEFVDDSEDEVDNSVSTRRDRNFKQSKEHVAQKNAAIRGLYNAYNKEMRLASTIQGEIEKPQKPPSLDILLEEAGVDQIEDEAERNMKIEEITNAHKAAEAEYREQSRQHYDDVREKIAGSPEAEDIADEALQHLSDLITLMAEEASRLVQSMPQYKSEGPEAAKYTLISDSILKVFRSLFPYLPRIAEGMPNVSDPFQWTRDPKKLTGYIFQAMTNAGMDEMTEMGYWGQAQERQKEDPQATETRLPNDASRAARPDLEESSRPSSIPKSLDLPMGTEESFTLTDTLQGGGPEISDQTSASLLGDLDYDDPYNFASSMVDSTAKMIAQILLDKRRVHENMLGRNASPEEIQESIGDELKTDKRLGNHIKTLISYLDEVRPTSGGSYKSNRWQGDGSEIFNTVVGRLQEMQQNPEKFGLFTFKIYEDIKRRMQEQSKTPLSERSIIPIPETPKSIMDEQVQAKLRQEMGEEFEGLSDDKKQELIEQKKASMAQDLYSFNADDIIDTDASGSTTVNKGNLVQFMLQYISPITEKDYSPEEMSEIVREQIIRYKPNGDAAYTPALLHILTASGALSQEDIRRLESKKQKTRKSSRIDGIPVVSKFIKKIKTSG